MNHRDATIDRLSQARDRLIHELSKVIVGQQRVIDELLICSVEPWTLSAGRRTRTGEDADDQHAREGDGLVVSSHPVHSGSDAGRHHRHGDH